MDFDIRLRTVLENLLGHGDIEAAMASIGGLFQELHKEVLAIRRRLDGMDELMTLPFGLNLAAQVVLSLKDVLDPSSTVSESQRLEAFLATCMGRAPDGLALQLDRMRLDRNNQVHRLSSTMQHLITYRAHESLTASLRLKHALAADVLQHVQPMVYYLLAAETIELCRKLMRLKVRPDQDLVEKLHRSASLSGLLHGMNLDQLNAAFVAFPPKMTKEHDDRSLTREQLRDCLHTWVLADTNESVVDLVPGHPIVNVICRNATALLSVAEQYTSGGRGHTRLSRLSRAVGQLLLGRLRRSPRNPAPRPVA